MKSNQSKKERRRLRVRAKVKGTTAIPRLTVWRGLKSINAQIIDDTTGQTLCQAHSRELPKSKKSEKDNQDKTAKVLVAYMLGELLAKKAAEKKIIQVVFDRAGNLYHGRVAAVADGARKGGLKF
jgi:large subunit ribosomal protein L18